jgi:UDP-N-acetylmuramoylalanine--D-glutamate ligase
MKGQRIAVLGVGRSGIAVARAAKALGAIPTAYDSAPSSSPQIQEASRLLAAEGVELIAGFDGPFRREETDVLITSPGVDSRSPLLQNAVRDGIEVIGEIEFAYRISKAPIIGITGTNGKSTTTVMTWLCLRAAGLDPVLCGNIYGSGYDEVPLTEAAANSTPGQVLVAEISSFQLEWITSFRPRCAGITNITPDHLNRYDTFGDYARTKRRLFEFMTEGDAIVFNIGDAATLPEPPTELDRIERQPKLYTFGTPGVRMGVETRGQTVPHELAAHSLHFSERHLLINASMALTLARAYLATQGLPEDSRLIDGLRQFKGLAHRMEHLGEKNGVFFINNSMCTNPAAVVSSSDALNDRQHLLIGGIKKEYDFRPVREYLERRVHRVYLFGRDAPQIAEELGGGWPVFNTMEEAFRAATDQAQAGDVVMLAPGCASMDQFRDFAERGDAFKSMAKEWLSR